MVRLLAGTALVVSLAVLAVWWIFGREEPPPVVDPTLERAVLPVIDDHLSQGPWRGMLSTRYAEATWLCSVDVIEIRHEGDMLKAGVDALCQEYVRAGDRLLAGSGEHAPKLVTLSGGPDHYQVRHVDTPPDGDAYWPSVQRMFSGAGQAELQRRRPMPDPAIEARQALGLPPDAPVEPAR